MSRRIALIVNPSAGGGRAARALPEAEAALREHGLPFRVEITRDLDHARALARAAAQAGEVTATLGGDGLVGCVAGVLRETPGAVLGLVPGGRGNDLARVLGIPPDPREACAVLAHGVERGLDVGEAEGRAFVGIASLGFDSDANRIANEAPSRLGNLVYAYGALRALAAWRPARFELTLDDETRTFSGYSVAAANSKAYGGGMYMAPDAELDDGLLDVVITEDLPKLRFLANLPKVFKGTHVREPEVHVLRSREVRVVSNRPFVVYADGDPIGATPITIRCVPRALRVLVPG
ncbi:MAG: diacylglycerol kinase family lipid kinase [Solirubrobacterales bacterium]|nr:diacylglycerol kinase family lipid kinase [Solirubrobacterales bacterium]